MYVLIEGKVSVGDRMIFEFCPGMSFGEIEILFKIPERKSSAICIENCECLEIDKATLLRNLNPDVNIQEHYNFFARQAYFDVLKTLS